MRRSSIFVAIATLAIAVSWASDAFAQPGLGGGPGLGRVGRPGFARRFGRFPGAAGFGNTNYTTLFDLYRTGKIPLPPYYSLHPPVYYRGIKYTSYGSTPFAFPHNWWQQYGFGSGGSPPGAIAPAIAAPPIPAQQVIQNPYMAGITRASDSAVVENRPAEPVENKPRIARAMVNPFYQPSLPAATSLAGEVLHD